MGCQTKLHVDEDDKKKDLEEKKQRPYRSTRMNELSQWILVTEIAKKRKWNAKSIGIFICLSFQSRQWHKNEKIKIKLENRFEKKTEMENRFEKKAEMENRNKKK